LAAAAQNIQQVRRVVPPKYLPALVRWRLDKLWTDPAFRQMQEGQMRFLLEHTERAGEVPELAYAYAEYTMLRNYLRWHPKPILNQRVRGAEWLTTARDPDRPVILSFMHHHRYEGMFASLARNGAPCHILALPAVIGPDVEIGMRQHIRLVANGGTLVPASGGTDAIAAQLRPGMIMAIASDVPGRTPVTFLGRRVLASFGAARIATMTNSQVVLARHRRDADGPYIEVDEPLEPRDFAKPAELLDEMLRRHGEAVLDWPEALDTPRARWGIIDE
jgi:lauroyl/myristoyl acyltransferase